MAMATLFIGQPDMHPTLIAPGHLHLERDGLVSFLLSITYCLTTTYACV